FCCASRITPSSVVCANTGSAHKTEQKKRSRRKDLIEEPSSTSSPNHSAVLKNQIAACNDGKDIGLEQVLLWVVGGSPVVSVFLRLLSFDIKFFRINSREFVLIRVHSRLAFLRASVY